MDLPAGIRVHVTVILAMQQMEVSHGKSNTGFALLLCALGLAGYLGTGSAHPTALIPTWFGLALGVFGFLAISPNERRRKLFMHINVTHRAAWISGRGGRAVYRLHACQFCRHSAGYDCAGFAS